MKKLKRIAFILNLFQTEPSKTTGKIGKELLTEAVELINSLIKENQRNNK